MEFARRQAIQDSLYPKRALIIYGPRRVGKTTLLNGYLSSLSKKRILSVTGDDLNVRSVYAKQTVADLTRLAAPYDIIAIDEAQQIPNIGIGTKILVDALPEKQYLLTGSSSFDLSSQIGEPLTGRHFTLTLLPISLGELNMGPFQINEALPDLLLYGSYPEVLLAPDTTTKQKLLNELVSSYLYKDVLALDKIRSPGMLHDLTKMVALQVGSEVSLNELAVALNTNVHTISRYLDILEKMFIIRRVRGFSRNLRNEITKKARYYFLDNGVRNAVIGQFQPLSQRNDVGALWENFIAMELLKRDNIAGVAAEYYFWRTHTGVEVDVVREHNGRLDAFECKWSKPAREPKLWRATYPESSFTTITQHNYLDVLIPSTSD